MDAAGGADILVTNAGGPPPAGAPAEALTPDLAPRRAVADAPVRFGFRWFIPELLKHKTVWRDVLAASLVLQLVGLTTPLFTQVIIDKVVVHQTGSTLLAIAGGLAMFLIFNAFLTWLRQYFILHTGNRIDAVLGSAVFRHMIRLHLRYFEQRPTGTLIARLHGVETIRQFISGAASCCWPQAATGPDADPVRPLTACPRSACAG